MKKQLIKNKLLEYISEEFSDVIKTNNGED
jgi:flagellar basal body-associated protein FliL